MELTPQSTQALCPGCGQLVAVEAKPNIWPGITDLVIAPHSVVAIKRTCAGSNSIVEVAGATRPVAGE